MGLEGAKSGAFVLRFFELIASIVAFATIVDVDWLGSRVKFTMFVGITGMILALFFMGAYIGGVTAARGTAAFVLDAIWLVFWLAAAACMSAVLNDGWNTNKVEASVAFSWISFFLWGGSTFVSFRDMRGGVVGPPPANAPTIPSSSVGMV